MLDVNCNVTSTAIDSQYRISTAEARGQFAGEVEFPPLVADSRRLVKTQQAQVCVLVNCKK
jgi:hypothetical protein